MRRNKLFDSNERGSSLVEFSIAVTVFLTVMFGVIEFGRALWVHNALADAARRGARYATVSKASEADKVKNVVVYGNPDGTGDPMLPNFSTTNVTVDYSGFGLNKGTVSVSITNYQFQFVIPIVGTTITMPNYTTTQKGESVGLVPKDM